MEEKKNQSKGRRPDRDDKSCRRVTGTETSGGRMPPGARAREFLLSVGNGKEAMVSVLGMSTPELLDGLEALIATLQDGKSLPSFRAGHRTGAGVVVELFMHDMEKE
jgi:hypothetical protein